MEAPLVVEIETKVQSLTLEEKATPPNPNKKKNPKKKKSNNSNNSNGSGAKKDSPRAPITKDDGTPLKSKPKISPKKNQINSNSPKKPKSPQFSSPSNPQLNFTDFSSFVSINGNLVQISLSERKLSSYGLENLTYWLNNRLKAIQERQKGRLRMHMELQENGIDDDGIEFLVKFLEKNHDTVMLKKLKLWNNKISDGGAFAIARLLENSPYPITEVHLSHNRITIEGAKKIIESAYKSGHYPRNSEGEFAPLWLRLEWNFIDVEVLNNFIMGFKEISVCFAHDRNKCGPRNCKYGAKAPMIHLYVMDLQFKALENAVFLKKAKKKVQESKKEAPLSQGNQVPTYIFLDTCAVLNMIEPPSFVQNPFAFAHSFTLKNLISKAKEKKFGDSFEADGDKVYIILTDTIMQEIDIQKKVRPEVRSSIVKYLQSEDGYINQCVRLNFLEVLGAHQGELLLKMTDNQLIDTSRVNDINLKNDLMLLNVALFWNTEIGTSGNVIVISADEEVKRRAKLHNLPAELLKVLDHKLSKLEPETPWTASVIKNCIPKAFENAGKPMGNPLVGVSLYKELESAIEMTKMLSNQMEILMKNPNDSENNKFSQELIEKTKEKISIWEEVIKNKPTSLKNM